MPDFRSLARAITAIENGASPPEPVATQTLTLGITGAPGAGKSTLVDAVAHELRRRNRTVAILAVDPSSRLTGGAILGDRIRMQQHHADPGVFIRSIAARGAHGGLARTTAAIAQLLRNAAFDVLLIETVGVGQDEIEIANLADVTLLVLNPNAGDDIQALKSGILDVATFYVLNKADQPGVERAEQDLRSSGRTASVFRTVATTGAGISELIDAIQSAPRVTTAATPTARHALQSLEDALRGFESAIGIRPGTLAVEYPAPGEVPVQIVRKEKA